LVNGGKGMAANERRPSPAMVPDADQRTEAGEPMIDGPAVFGFLGVLLGFVAGGWIGGAHGWLIGVPAALGGAVVGGPVFWFLSLVFLDEIPDRLERLSRRRAIVGNVLFWSYLVFVLVVLTAGVFLLRGVFRAWRE
jgi:hypothetical protein